jgi:hypothetical protein
MKRTGMKIFALFLIFLFIISFIAAADTFRCPNGDLASTGDKIAEVAMKCGQPTYKTHRVVESGSYRGFASIEIDEWTYNMGPRDFVYTLIFRNGILFSIESGGYGK